MSGVIDADGQQWEHCGECSSWVKIQDLGYEKPSIKFPYGKDLCVKCVDKLIRSRQVKFGNIVPAATWKRTLVKT